MTLHDTLLKAFGHSFRIALGFLSLGLICMGAMPQSSLANSPEVVDRIVAVVNDDIIVLQDVDKLLQPLQAQIQTAGYSDEQKHSMLLEMRQKAIDQLVDQKLIDQSAQEFGVKVEEAEIDASLERIKQQNQLTDEQLQETLKKEGLSLESLRDQLKQQILASRLENYEVRSKIVITKEDVTEYYKQNADKYKGEKTYHLRNILIKSPQTDDPAGKKAVEDKLTKIFAEFKAGKSFETLARQYSESQYADEGGELGKFRLDDLSPNLRAAIEPLSPGGVTPALETSDGYQIIFVQEILQKPGKSLDSAYKEIEDKLFEEQYKKKREAWIENLRKAAHIKIIE